MDTRKEITELKDIKVLVDEFYSTVRKDELIGPVFSSVIKENWAEHLEKMYTFWQTVLLGIHTYNGNPFVPHALLEIKEIHFNRWLKLWCETVDIFFRGRIAEDAKWRADKMALMFRAKLEYYQTKKSKPII